jgi:hypothetical protein
MTVSNLTAATSNLFDLISARQLVLYPDEAMRLAISHAIIVESARGWRLDKLKQSHKIDVIVALSLAALAAVRTGATVSYNLNLDWIDTDTDVAPADASAVAADAVRVGRFRSEWQRRNFMNYCATGGYAKPPWAY